MAITKLVADSITSGVAGVNTPYFQAKINSNQSLSDNVLTKINFDSEIFDTDNCYDTTNKRFTPTSAGKYNISVQVFLSSNTPTNLVTGILSIYKNGSEVMRADSYYSTNYVDSDFFIVEQIIDFNGTTDYVEAYASIDCNNDTGMTIYRSNNRCLFQGYKIIE